MNLGKSFNTIIYKISLKTKVLCIHALLNNRIQRFVTIFV